MTKKWHHIPLNTWALTSIVAKTVFKTMIEKYAPCFWKKYMCKRAAVNRISSYHGLTVSLHFAPAVCWHVQSSHEARPLHSQASNRDESQSKTWYGGDVICLTLLGAFHHPTPSALGRFTWRWRFLNNYLGNPLFSTGQSNTLIPICQIKRAEGRATMIVYFQ